MEAHLADIQAAFLGGQYDITKHGFVEMLDDGVTTGVLEHSIGKDEPAIIEDYPEDTRGPCCLILGWTESNEPIHICLGYGGSDFLVITVYRPDPARWTNRYRTRR